MSFQWRADAPYNLVELAIGRCMIAQLDEAKWKELGLLTGSEVRINNHPRLLRSLSWGDDDYEGHVYTFVPVVLGVDSEGFTTPPTDPQERFPNLDLVSDFIDLEAWLALKEPDLFARLHDSAAAGAKLPDGTVLSEAEAVAARLGVTEITRQVKRIRRDYSEDPEGALGQAKELLESTCKTILGLTGDGTGNRKVPELVKQTQMHLGIHPSQQQDKVEAEALRKMFSGVTSILVGANELRNARGTGHGRSGSPELNESVARLTVGLVLPTAIYLTERWEKVAGSGTSQTMAASEDLPSELQPGSFFRDSTHGEGQILKVESTQHGAVATVNFGPRIGERKVLVR